ncbi:hypothetical protein NLG97_g1602 [Lecanicillium saksenae]|uniref:Uncharacterized protein n=1 Tax=Lecanicillium saksenae TaxID=468837 RepID=A0ACC1R522_9HYPO|nr:hypothetical protein NLG97_g1602 [Lecanicillium saksenae]
MARRDPDGGRAEMENMTEVPSGGPLPLLWTLYRRGIVRDPDMGTLANGLLRAQRVGTRGRRRDHVSSAPIQDSEESRWAFATTAHNTSKAAQPAKNGCLASGSGACCAHVG